MNKKGDVEISKLIVIFLAVIALIAVALWFYKGWGAGTSTVSDFQKNVKPDSNLFNLNDKSFSLEEKERCAHFTNLNNCIGSKESKTGCFWGKTSSGIGCYTCKNNKYFEDNYGKCFSYTLLSRDIVKGSDFEKICEINPCDFISSKKDQKNCNFELVGSVATGISQVCS